VSKALTVLPIDLIHRLLHLGHAGSSTSIQRLLHHRLFRTGGASKGQLQARISSQTTVDFAQPVCSSQQTDKAIIQFFDGRLLDRLLGNVDPLANGAKDIQLVQLHSDRCQARSGGKMARRFRDRLVHDGSPLSVREHTSERGMAHHLSFGKSPGLRATCR
jgi:hypothetical protein